MIENFVRVRVVVAGQSEARFYDATGAAVKMKLIDKLTDPNARLHDRDMVSDKAGRVFDHAAAPGQRRGSVSHHSTGGERSPRKHEAVVFARQVVHQLETEHRASPFGRLVVMAGPAFLGLLREAMPKALREITVAEVCKDLLHDNDGGVLSHIPREAFEPAFKPYYSAHG
jgi:protein required for attachment to host cells